VNNNKDKRWQIWIDTGGTFTDCVALDKEGVLHKTKVLSNSSLRGAIREILTPYEISIKSSWSLPADFIKGFHFSLLKNASSAVKVDSYDPDLNRIIVDKPCFKSHDRHEPFEVKTDEEAPILAARIVTNCPLTHILPKIQMRLATTKATNALLEHSGASVAFFITKGFGDLLTIGNQQRPDLFALPICKPKMLYHSVIEVPERTAADGSIIVKLDLESLKEKIRKLVQAGIDVAAVALLHSYSNPIHESELRDYLLRSGFSYVSCSSQLVPFIKILPRSETTIINAYLSPIIDDYLAKVQRSLKKGTIHIMTSAGGLAQPKYYHPKDSLLSGPAGGVVGMVLAARRSNFSKIIAFDMGGTSTDVARFDGDYDYVFEHDVGDAHLVAPALAIESVAAGGGSICRYDRDGLQVGPESAGADPGPACYAAGGPLTLTDVNLLLGRLDASRFEIPISKINAEKEFNKLIRALDNSSSRNNAPEKLLQGFLDIANERMADAIRRISIRQGYDPRNYTLVAFGGAGGQHACAVAELLNMDSVLIPKDASLLSSFGLGYAAIERFAERQILHLLDTVAGDIDLWIRELAQRAVQAVQQEGVPKDEIEVTRRIINLRFFGQESVLQIEYNKPSSIRSDFRNKYKSIFDHWQKDRAIEVESIRVVAAAQLKLQSDVPANVVHYKPHTNKRLSSYFNDKWHMVSAFERSELMPGAEISGPALILEAHSLTVLENNWSATVDGSEALILYKKKSHSKPKTTIHPEIVQQELFTNRFSTIAREMGEMLRRTAISTNIKERLDFSCALLDKNGELVVNAPHIPVHLGALGLCVRSIKRTLDIRPGDVIITNHPQYGGSHLPDISIVSPVYCKNGQLLGFVANRAHHAEIGGISPGSMPAKATSLIEEGVVIPPTFLLRKGKENWSKIYQILKNAPYPSRAIEENLADIRAAVAANYKGVNALIELASLYGAETIWHYMDVLKKRAEVKTREALLRFPPGTYQAQEKLDDGSPLCAHITIANDYAIIDFTGSSDVHKYNLNMTPAIVSSVVIYVLRLLIDEPLPLNEGIMHVIKLHIPRGILSPDFNTSPDNAPAVMGGNVETSQRLVDTFLKLFKIVGCSQGTMNNVAFGTEKYSYYETVCGGCGAGSNFHGASAVHSHMTNTRITDPEIIEHRYPVRLEKFAIRRNSGGKGKYRGGDGVIREITFLDKMQLSVLGQHRIEKPYGMEGGEPGKSAQQYVIRSSGKYIYLKSADTCDVDAGDCLILKTPGGGGYGRISKKR
jgi:5-oxoprolinase (ATP-hydrolysing)